MPGDFGTTGANFAAVDRIATTYASRVHNGEINFILPYGSIQYLAGFRYFELDENFNITGTDTLLGSSSTYSIQTGNHLYGSQLGVRTQWEVGRFIFDAECKAGAYANIGQQHQTVNDPALLPRNTGAQERQAAFVGEVAAYAFIPMGSHFTGRLGYTGVWVTDLALAPNQIDFSNTATSGTGVNMCGSTIIHGFNAGVETRW